MYYMEGQSTYILGMLALRTGSDYMYSKAISYPNPQKKILHACEVSNRVC